MSCAVVLMLCHFPFSQHATLMIRLPAILQHRVWVCGELFTNASPFAFAFVALMFANVMLCIMDTGLSVHKDPLDSHLPQWLIDWADGLKFVTV